jgi:hypothetical protein
MKRAAQKDLLGGFYSVKVKKYVFKGLKKVNWFHY